MHLVYPFFAEFITKIIEIVYIKINQRREVLMSYDFVKTRLLIDPDSVNCRAKNTT